MACRFSEQALPYGTTPVDNLFLMEYLPRATGLEVQVYLYGLFLCRHPMGEEELGAMLARRFSAERQAILAAFAHWQAQGLLRIEREDPLEIEYLPLRAEGYAKPALPRIPGECYALVERLQGLLAPRTFGMGELRRVRDWLEVYHMEEDAVVRLIEHCLACTGGSAGIQYFDAVARDWADHGVRTKAEAEAHIAAHQARMSGASAILKRWNVDRLPTKDELRLYEKWQREWGFSDQAILAACAEVTSTTRLSFKYLNGILKRLHEQRADVSETLAREAEQRAFAEAVFAAAGIAGGADIAKREALAALRERLPGEVILLAAEAAREKKNPYAYLKSLAGRWVEAGITTVDAARAALDTMRSAPRAAKPGFDYEQRAYSDEELASVIVDLEGKP